MLEKRLRNLLVTDIALVKLAVFFFTLWLIGMLPTTIDFLIEWKWAFFALMLIFGVKPFWRFMFGKHSVEAEKKKKKKMKKAAIELSIGTIVIVVLAMSMLILGIILINNIFKGSIDIADMTNEQLKNQVSQLFGNDKKLVVYPDSRIVKIEQGEVNGFGIGIKNLIEGSSEAIKFSYEVVVSDPDLRKKCGISEQEALEWISTGKSEDNIEIASGDFASSKVLFNIPVGASLCTLRYRVNVKANGQSYASDFMDVVVKAK